MKDFYFSPQEHYLGEIEYCDDLHKLLDRYFGTKEREGAFTSRKANLLQFITRHRDKTAKKAEKCYNSVTIQLQGCNNRPFVG